MKRVIVAIWIFLLCLPGTGCLPASDFDQQLQSIVRQYTFSIVGWEFGALWQEAWQLFAPGYPEVDNEPELVIRYFSLVEQIKGVNGEIGAITSGDRDGDVAGLQAELTRLEEQRTALIDTVERILEQQIREVLTEQGIMNPFDRYLPQIPFPPMNFEMGLLPYLLVVSPRDRIESIREVNLKQGINLEEIGAIEAQVDQLGVSSLVVKLGGLGATFPTLVTRDGSLRFTIDTAVEEWLHQYLTFRPLGFSYVLDLSGISPNYDVATMNETVAGMVSKEIGAIVCQRYYAMAEVDGDELADEAGFDFNREMRDIRRAVDQYLVQGEIEMAEAFMEQRRRYLAANGYYIRKLNQAYFAFYGTYADRPTSISPIGRDLRKLRDQSPSLKDFLDAVAVMSSRQKLTDSLE